MEFFFNSINFHFYFMKVEQELKDICEIIWVQILSGVFQCFSKSFTIIFPRFNLIVFILF